MPQAIVCPHCAVTVKVPETLAGRQVACPKCRTTLVEANEDSAPPPAPPSVQSVKVALTAPPIAQLVPLEPVTLSEAPAEVPYATLIRPPVIELPSPPREDWTPVRWGLALHYWSVIACLGLLVVRTIAEPMLTRMHTLLLNPRRNPGFMHEFREPPLIFKQLIMVQTLSLFLLTTTIVLSVVGMGLCGAAPIRVIRSRARAALHLLFWSLAYGLAVFLVAAWKVANNTAAPMDLYTIILIFVPLVVTLLGGVVIWMWFFAKIGSHFREPRIQVLAWLYLAVVVIQIPVQIGWDILSGRSELQEWTLFQMSWKVFWLVVPTSLYLWLVARTRSVLVASGAAVAGASQR